MKVDFSTAIVGLILGIPAFALGVAGLIRSFRVDKSTAKQAVAAARGDEIQQIIDGMKDHVVALQEDNRIWRESLQSVSLELTKCVEQRIKDREEMQRQIAELQRQLDELS